MSNRRRSVRRRLIQGKESEPMRKIIVGAMVSMRGVLQSPGVFQ
jgi:hypothetical protein